MTLTLGLLSGSLFVALVVLSGWVVLVSILELLWSYFTHLRSVAYAAWVLMAALVVVSLYFGW